MDDKLLLELFNRIEKLEARIEKLENALPGVKQGTSGDSSKKYISLTNYLRNSGQNRVHLSFLDMETILKTRLPSEATCHRVFWVNTKDNSLSVSWLNAGYEAVEVNIPAGFVVFEKR